MVLFVIAYLGGALTIVSPCILPVLPFVFARADGSFVRSRAPIFAGMALAFCAVGTLAAVGGSWAIEANRYGRATALVVLALFGLFMLVPALSDRMLAPIAAIGGRLSRSINEPGATSEPSIASSLLLGVATGPALGAVRGTRAWPHPHGCGVARREPRNVIAAACLRRRGGDVVGARGFRRRPGAYGDEALARCRRVDPAGPRRRRARRPWRRSRSGLDTGVLTRLSLAPVSSSSACSTGWHAAAGSAAFCVGDDPAMATRGGAGLDEPKGKSRSCRSGAGRLAGATSG